MADTVPHLCLVCSSIFTTSQRYDVETAMEYMQNYGPDEIAENQVCVKLPINATSLSQAAGVGCYICARLWKSLHSIAEDVPVENIYQLDIEIIMLIRALDEGSFKLTLYLQNGPLFRPVEFFAFSERKADELGLKEYLPTHTGSVETLQQARDWIEHCHHHEECQQQPERPIALPSRLIHVQQENSQLTARLCYGHSLNAATEYLYLSHCWGKTKFLTLTKANHDQFLISIPIPELSRTFQDAIHVTIELQFHYIWIDSLCIVQDDNDDWCRESQKMADIYMNSALNICASGFANGVRGFLPANRALDPSPVILTVSWNSPEKLQSYVGKTYRLIDGQPFEELWTGAPLISRAWVLQEQLLAPRALHFGTGQMFWDCRQSLACEIWPSKWLDSPLNGLYKNRYKHHPYEQFSMKTLATRKQDNPYDIWKYLIRNYTGRVLTYPSDRLPALHGIATEFARTIYGSSLTSSSHLQDSYLHGIWRDELPHGLLWQGGPPQDAAQSIQKPSNTPSWTWASLNQPVFWYESCFHKSTESDLEDDKICRIHPVGERYLRICGMFISIDPQDCDDKTQPSESPEPDPEYFFHFSTRGYTLWLSLDQWYVEEVTPPNEDGLYQNSPSRGCFHLQNVFIMPLIRSKENHPPGYQGNGVLGLVLLPKSVGVETEQSNQKDVFYRVGTALMYWSAYAFAEDVRFEKDVFAFQKSVEKRTGLIGDAQGRYTVLVA